MRNEKKRSKNVKQAYRRQVTKKTEEKIKP